MNTNSSEVRFFIVIGVYPSGFTFIVGVCLALTGLLSCLQKYYLSMCLITFKGTFINLEMIMKGSIALGLFCLSGSDF